MKKLYSLILKDLIMQKSNYSLFIILLITVSAYKFNDLIGCYALLIVAISNVVSYITYTDDNKNNTFYLNSLPYSRGLIVTSKFIFMQLVTFALCLFFIVINSDTMNYKDIILIYFYIAVSNLFYFPLYYKFNAIIANGVIMTIMILPAVLGGLLVKDKEINVDKNQLAIFRDSLGTLELVSISILSIVIIFIAYKLSKYLYMRKEL